MKRVRKKRIRERERFLNFKNMGFLSLFFFYPKNCFLGYLFFSFSFLLVNLVSEMGEIREEMKKVDLGRADGFLFVFGSIFSLFFFVFVFFVIRFPRVHKDNPDGEK